MHQRFVRATALILGVTMTLAALIVLLQGTRDAEAKSQSQDRRLTAAAQASAALLAEHFERAVAADLQLAAQPAFKDFYRLPGTVDQRIRKHSPVVSRVEQGLSAIEKIFPDAVSEVCFIDLRSGQEIARIVDGKAAQRADLSPDESGAVFFKPTREQPIGVPYQSQPYVSEDTGLWVVATSTLIAVQGQPRALVHFETSVESLRGDSLAGDGQEQLRTVDVSTGDVVLDDGVEQAIGAELGVPTDTTFADVSPEVVREVTTDIGTDRAAFAPLPLDGGLEARNANKWAVVASAPTVSAGLGATATPIVIGLLAIGLPLIILGLIAYAQAFKRAKDERQRESDERAVLDARMDQLSEAMARAASGDLDVTFDVDLGDVRVTALAQGFDATLTHLRTLVAQAQFSGSRLADSAAELRASSTYQAKAAAEQSTAVTETTATVEELAATAAQIADTATDVANSAKETLGLTEEGLSAVRDSVAAMDRITEKVGSIASSSATLDEKVNEIGRILALINELSEQTNLLALNAAIEAARAGEHGRGFAVVAAEVRKLAERAQESTALIQNLVGEIQVYTQTTVLASEDGAREASHGVEVAGSAVSALDRIADMVDNTTSAVAEISVATRQQRSASDQVVTAMGQVAEVVVTVRCRVAASCELGRGDQPAGRGVRPVDLRLPNPGGQ